MEKKEAKIIIEEFLNDCNETQTIKNKTPLRKAFDVAYKELCKQVDSEHITDHEVEKLWNELEDVLFIEDNNSGDSCGLVLANNWNIWEKGTTRDEIWRWFNQNHSFGLGWLVYAEKPNENDMQYAKYSCDTKNSVITTQKEFDKLYKKYGLNNPDITRNTLSKDEERKFVNDCFETYEHIGFAKTFGTPYTGEEKYVGMKFTVLCRVKEITEDKENGADLECLPMWNIQLENGDIMAAYPEEICLAERK